MHHFGVIFNIYMYKSNKFLSALIFLACVFKSFDTTADVYGGGFWEAIGLGNMPCSDFLSKTEDDAAYKELGAVWLSGFMSGVNFTSNDVYDITWGEDIYVLTDLVIERCKQQPEKLISDIATDMVYKRYQDKNFTPTSDINN